MKKNIRMKNVQKKIVSALKGASTHLEGLGRETKDLVRRGESELNKISRLGKSQFEILSLSVKKEQLYRQIGMRVWQLSTQGKLSTKRLEALCEELSAINKKLKTQKKTMNDIIGTKDEANQAKG